MDGLLRRFAPRNDEKKHLCLLNFFPEHFQLQPPVFGRRKFYLRGGDGGGSLIEFLAIFPVEIGVVKQALLFCNIRLQLFDGLRQRFQRVFFVEAEPALWRRCGRSGTGIYTQ